MKVLLLGASGGVGRCILRHGIARRHELRAQTRDAAHLGNQPSGIEVVAADPSDATASRALMAGQEAVIMSLGTVPGRRTTLFSDVTAKMIAVMTDAGVRRLVAITGVGAGETLGHGGFVYDRIVYPLFTRPLYRDKNRQEMLIRRSALDWIIVRPAPFKASCGAAPLQAITDVKPDTVLRRITRDEVASFVVDQLTSDRYLHQPVFIGHAR